MAGCPIKGFMWCHIKPILQVIILTTATLVSSLHRAVLENTTKCHVTFYLLHTTICVTRILAYTFCWNFNSFYEVNQKFKCFLLFFSIIPYHKKGNQAEGQNCEHMHAYCIVQMLYSFRSACATCKKIEAREACMPCGMGSRGPLKVAHHQKHLAQPYFTIWRCFLHRCWPRKFD